MCSVNSFGEILRPASRITTFKPASDRRFAAQPPVAPEPTTIASYISVPAFCPMVQPPPNVWKCHVDTLAAGAQLRYDVLQHPGGDVDRRELFRRTWLGAAGIAAAALPRAEAREFPADYDAS